MKVIIAAGGSAGHVNPGLAIADKIKQVYPGKESSVLFIGTPGGMEARLVKAAGYDFVSIKMAGLQRSLSPKNLIRNARAAHLYLHAGRKARAVINKFKPDIVIGMGAYISVPAVNTAAKMGIKTAIHESNSYPGVAMKFLSKYADKIFVGDEDGKKRMPHPEKCVITGNPLRSNLKMEARETARKKLGLPEGLTILSSGGSNGSNAITEAVIALIERENEVGGINHIHSYGRNRGNPFAGVKLNPERTVIKEYLDNMYTCLSAADLVISRSGAMSQTEIKAAGRASVQIPWAGSAEYHQYYNALAMEKGGAAVMIEDKDLTPQKLIEVVMRLCQTPQKLRDMEIKAKEMSSEYAADKILGEILDLIKTQGTMRT
ncbi:MAG: UDP-N-acetylglucosamine--N-acetylmuramyl-(pentapeptide) pyrophosphoryl-undecaprenol N-acetylglucosamine transferase [Oscillospiraceae bacterium]|jgi:UDP-N-acetylglucosamine--N-acetylmuramyl-(pentapeptide) pyrophosphoryl-undecaprenol N-acetylglucosamine transferase|nr:UDP-N-acetylglucosamine--N-acetylmuramyl-(pentapeptide) pyrophosphoryl-undecaprenol N-acetylglucosamine transferase [Oscillospiraceae bacterium]